MPDAKVAPSSEEKDAKADEVKGKRNMKERINQKHVLLLSMKTADYADDGDIYEARLNSNIRIKYWQELLKNKRPRPIPYGFRSWVQVATNKDKELSNYPIRYLLAFNIIKSRSWDQTYLSLLFVWLIIVIALFDGYIETYAPKFIVELVTPSSVVLLLPIVLMIIVITIPTLGIIYFMVVANDLVKYLAQKEFGEWAFTAVLVAQFVENYFYGGRGKTRLAGTVRVDPNKKSLFAQIGVFTGVVKEYVEEEETLEKRMKKYGLDVEANEERDEEGDIELGKDNDSVAESVENVAPEDMGVLARLKAQKKAEEDEAKRIALEERLKEEALVTDWTEWKCLVCAKDNRKPTHPKLINDVFFGTTGEYYKRTYGKITPRRDIPVCDKCWTPSDYKPPLSSAHYFPKNTKPYVAFDDFPRKASVHNGLTFGFISKYGNIVSSFLFGIQNNHFSRLVFNDWRLPIYLSSIFPELPRQIKPADELYSVGEIVECKLQRSEWQRAKIIAARSNHTYDIRYDPGDELRLVQENLLRLPPEKRDFAYKVEICIVFIVWFLPISIIAAFQVSPGLILFSTFIVSGLLFCIRMFNFVKYTIRYINAGCCIIFKQTMLFASPLLFLVLASGACLLKDSVGITWSTIAILLIITKVLSLPTLYMLRPMYVLICGIVFLQTSVFAFLIAKYLDGTPISPMIAVALAPALTTVLTLKYIRKHLHLMWDPCIIIRPPVGYIVDSRSMFEKFLDLLGFGPTS